MPTVGKLHQHGCLRSAGLSGCQFDRRKQHFLAGAGDVIVEGHLEVRAI